MFAQMRQETGVGQRQMEFEQITEDAAEGVCLSAGVPAAGGITAGKTVFPVT